MVKLSSEFEVVCPCCGTAQTIDPHLKRVVGHRVPEREDKPELDEAQRILAEAAERREALFQQSVSDQKTRGDALSSRPSRNRSPAPTATSISTEPRISKKSEVRR